MKHIFALLIGISLISCQKKNTSTETETSTSTTTTTGTTPTPTVESFAAELEVNSTDYNYGYASAKFYNSDKIALSMDFVKINGMTMGTYPGNEYRYALASSTYTSAVSWEISSSVSYIPDTTFVSPALPKIGYQKDITKVYDKSLDFTVNVDPSDCDSLFFTLGTVVKKVPGKSGITSITFKPADKINYSVTDSARVDVNVMTVNYSVFKVRGKKWKSISTTKSISYYKYK